MHRESNITISSGIGRLHFIESALALKKKGVGFILICGYVPKASHVPVLNLIGRLLGKHDLANRLAFRLEGGLFPHLRGSVVAEGVAALLLKVAPSKLRYHEIILESTWRLFGFLSKQHINGGRIFHVRSGAGQGGAIAKAKRLGMKVIVDQSIAHPAVMKDSLAHEYAQYGIENNFNAERRFWKLVLDDCRAADILLVNSDYVKKTFMDKGWAERNIKVCYLGVREDFVGLKSSYDRGPILKLLFTGSFDIRKGCSLLVSMMECLTAMGVLVELHVIGDATQGVLLFSDRLSEIGIRLHGFVPQAQLSRFFKDSDIYVFPTYCEGCAKSAMEAMAAGIPVVTTVGCGLPGVPNVHYLTVEAGDSNSLVKAVLHLMDDEVARGTLGRAGKDLVKRDFKWSDYANKLADIYIDLGAGT